MDGRRRWCGWSCVHGTYANDASIRRETLKAKRHRPPTCCPERPRRAGVSHPPIAPIPVAVTQGRRCPLYDFVERLRSPAVCDSCSTATKMLPAGRCRYAPTPPPFRQPCARPSSSAPPTPHTVTRVNWFLAALPAGRANSLERVVKAWVTLRHSGRWPVGNAGPTVPRHGTPAPSHLRRGSGIV